MTPNPTLLATGSQFTTWHEAWQETFAGSPGLAPRPPSPPAGGPGEAWPELDTRVGCRTGRWFRASGAVLAAHSRWLKQLINREVEQALFWDASPEVTAAILRFLHVGRVQISPDLVPEIRAWLTLLQIQDKGVEWPKDSPSKTRRTLALSPPPLISKAKSFQFRCEACHEVCTNQSSAREHLERHMTQTRDSFSSWMTELFGRGYLHSPIICGGCQAEVIVGLDTKSIRECAAAHVDACNARWMGLMESVTKQALAGKTAPAPLVWRKNKSKVLKASSPSRTISRDPLSTEESAKNSPGLKTLFDLCESSSQCFVPQCRRPMSIFHLVRHTEIADILRKEIPIQTTGNYECDYCDHFPKSQSRLDLITHLVSHWEQSTPSFLLNYTLSDLNMPEQTVESMVCSEVTLTSQSRSRCSKTVSNEVAVHNQSHPAEAMETPSTSNAPKYPCQFCPNGESTFIQDDQREKHQCLTHFRLFFDNEAPSVYPWICDEPDCQFIVVDSESYAIHSGIVHGRLEEALKEKTVTAKKRGRPPKNKRLVQALPVKKHKAMGKAVDCQLCPTRFHQMSELIRHYTTSHYYSRIDCSYREPERRVGACSFSCMEPLSDGTPCKSKFLKRPTGKAMQLHMACVHDGIRKILAKDGIVPEKSGEWPESQIKIPQKKRKRKMNTSSSSESTASPKKKRTSSSTVVANGSNPSNLKELEFVCQKCEESFPSRLVKDLHTCHSILDKHFLADDRKSRPIQGGAGPSKSFLANPL